MSNQLVTLDELNRDLRKFWREEFMPSVGHFSEMFIEHQMKWERQEFDDHG